MSVSGKITRPQEKCETATEIKEVGDGANYNSFKDCNHQQYKTQTVLKPVAKAAGLP